MKLPAEFARLLCLAMLAVAFPPLANRAAGQSCLAGTAADEFTADAAGLTRQWIVQLPFVTGGATLAQVVPGDGLVVAQTSDGTVHAIQDFDFSGAPPPAGAPLPGSLLWSRRVDTYGAPAARAGIGADIVAVAHDRGITALERQTGHVRWHESLQRGESGGTAVIGNWVYSPTSGHAIGRFATHPLRQPDETPAAEPESKTPKQKAAKKTAKPRKQRKENLAPLTIEAEGDVRYTPRPLADGVLWCTTSGLLVTLQTTKLDWQRLDFSLVNPPAGPPATAGRSIFAATTAGDLARIDLPPSLKQMQLAWHAVLPGPATSGPFLAGDTVVVSLGDLGLAAYSAETGAMLWRCGSAGRILATGGDRVWFIDALGKLSSLSLADGSPRERLCLGPFTLPIVNGLSDRILLASPSGMVASLLPRGPRGTPTPAAAGAASAPAARARGAADPDATP